VRDIKPMESIMEIYRQSSGHSLTCGALFAGAGGFAVGFSFAGFTPLFFNEIDQQAASTFSLNFPQTLPFVCPIQELTAQHIRDECPFTEDLDVMIGGPPCQGFSINAPLRRSDDPRNSLFQHYARLVLEGLRPRFIVMENVPGLLSLDQGKTLKAVISAFEQSGYKVIFHILNAAHYGVPEERWRLFILGTRLTDIKLSFPSPTHYSYQRPNFTGGRDYTFSYAIKAQQQSLWYTDLLPSITVGEAIDDLPPIPSGGGAYEMDYTTEPHNSYQRRLRADAQKLYNHECGNVSEINLERMKYVLPGGSWRDIPFDLLPKGMQRARRSDHTRRYGRLERNGISGTILTKCDPHWGSFFHYEQNRVISIREAARIQSFPDWFRFTGTKGEQYRQVGNAVPPLLAYAIAHHIKNLLATSQEKSAIYATSQR
jgi:DNA (cytosine-5)-methyltransferase 1